MNLKESEPGLLKASQSLFLISTVSGFNLTSYDMSRNQQSTRMDLECAGLIWNGWSTEYNQLLITDSPSAGTPPRVRKHSHWAAQELNHGHLWVCKRCSEGASVSFPSESSGPPWGTLEQLGLSGLTVLTHDQQRTLKTIRDFRTSSMPQGLQRWSGPAVGGQHHQGLYDHQGAFKDSTTFPGHNLHWLTPINIAPKPIVQFFSESGFIFLPRNHLSVLSCVKLY
jgi:hypothetical protein